MRIGQEVRYIDAEGKSHMATIQDITGVGDSNYKVLNLRYHVDGKDVEVEDVHHEGDAEEKQGFWLMKGERRTRSPEDEEVEEGSRVDTTAFPEPPQTSALGTGEDNPSGRKGKDAKAPRTRH